MPQATVGVIGHVNHGKTSLVKALTGTDTDRLEEERRRGMSIVLGFAWLETPQGTIDLIDVPGHEQFVRTMVSAATGITASLLVVNGREGVMPQTVEHVGIADLVGIRRGVVAITRADLLPPPQRAEVQRSLRAFLQETHLRCAPVVFTSAVTGEGIAELKRHLAALAAASSGIAPSAAHFSLPVDRVFTLAGHGTVATGTLRGAALRVGDAIEVLPGGARASVRQLQVHNRAVDEALPGQRVGVNLRHVDLEQVARGDVLATPGSLRPAMLLDVQLALLPGVQPEQVDGRRVRLLFGTTEIPAVVRVLSRQGGTRPTLLAQLRASRAVVTLAGEPCILRRESPAATLGGGRVLDPAAPRHRRADAMAVRRLRILAGGSERQRLAEKLKAAGAAGTAVAALAAELQLAPDQCDAALRGLALTDGARAWHLPFVEHCEQAMLQALRAWHAAHPLQAAAPVAVCRAALPAAADDALCRLLLSRLQSVGQVRRRDGRVALAGHDPLQGLAPAERAQLAALETAYREAGMHPPDAPGPGLRARALLELLVERGDVLLLPGQPPTQRIALHRAAVAKAGQRLRAAYPPPAAFTVSQARELLGSTRKFTVPLLEHLHATGQTRRRGDLHAFVAERDPGGE